MLPLGFVGSPPSPPQSGPALPLNGRQLQFVVGGLVGISILFAGTDPLTFGQVASQINAQGQDLLFSYVFGSTLVVQTIQAGGAAALQCLNGDAAPALGLPTDGSVAFGQDARLVLRQGVENYSYVDPNGSSTFFYKIRFFNSVSQLTSEFSLPVQGGSPAQVPPANLVRCYVDLSDAQGAAISNQEVLVYVRFSGAQAGGFTVVGSPIRMLTDVNGHAELMLLRGVQATVTIGGTDLARQVTVPTNPTVLAINFLDPTVGTDDLFNVQVPDLRLCREEDPVSIQSQMVFRHCVGIADELEADNRLEEAESVLRSLSLYLDVLPATSDASCKHTVEGRLNRLSPRVREKKRCASGA